MISTISIWEFPSYFQFHRFEELLEKELYWWYSKVFTKSCEKALLKFLFSIFKFKNEAYICYEDFIRKHEQATM